jgi:NAD(P)-dependent dehydrogenase (short-subunit alcohol dehydrogenase family)
MSLEGKVAFVSGASRRHGNGRAIALTLAGRGADVAVSGWSHIEGAMSLAEEIKEWGEGPLPLRWMLATTVMCRRGLPESRRS